MDTLTVPERIRTLVPGGLPALTPTEYARAHAVWEAASDQRAVLRDWLVAELPPLVAHVTGRPLGVLGVGVGDGSVDAAVAAALAAGGRRVDYTGVEPHRPSAGAFARRLAGLGLPGLTVRTEVGPFGAGAGGGPVDLVHFVHSLYYVPDPDAAVDRALALLRPDGVLVTLIAPLEPLCVLTEALAPRTGHRQWFAGDVAAAVARTVRHGRPVRAVTLDARLDLAPVWADPDGTGELLLDFLVQGRTAGLPVAARALLWDHLESLLLPGPGQSVPHPLEVLVVPARAGRAVPGSGR